MPGDTRQRKLVDNAPHATEAKIAIRRAVLEAIGRDKAIVFDAFAGSGVMWKAVWREAADYVGCDEKRWYRDERCCFVADNRRVLRCVDLTPFTIFDLDAFGSPWQQAMIIAARRELQPGERVGLVITDGLALATKYLHLPPAFRLAADLSARAAEGAHKFHDDLLARALTGVARRMGARVGRQWRARSRKGAQVRYLGAVLEPDAGARAARRRRGVNGH